MKKMIGVLSWLLAIAGVCMIVLTTTLLDRYILFYVGIGMLLIGIVGGLFAGKETKAAILKLLDFI